MRSVIKTVTWHCADALALARFWSDALGHGFDRRGLRPCRRLELDDQVGRDPATVADLDALALGPLADL